MKFTLAISAFVASTLAQYQTEDPEPRGPAYFGVMSTRSASPVHLLPLTARAGKFYLGGPGPTSYCPEPVQDACPPGNQTVLAGGYGTLSLAVAVPGGQQVYVAPDGTLSYTPPHSAYIPDGSVTNGWSRTEGETFGSLSFEGGLVACPAGEGRGYQVFGQINNVTPGDECLGFNALTINATDPGAWEY